MLLFIGLSESRIRVVAAIESEKKMITAIEKFIQQARMGRLGHDWISIGEEMASSLAYTDSLKTRLEISQENLGEIMHENRLNLERAEKAEKMLHELEYIKLDAVFGEGLMTVVTPSIYGRYKFCPCCGYKEPDGHWRDCELAEALGQK